MATMTSLTPYKADSWSANHRMVAIPRHSVNRNTLAVLQYTNKPTDPLNPGGTAPPAAYWG